MLINVKLSDGTVKKMCIEDVANKTADDLQFAELRKQIVERDRYEIERRLRVYVSAAVQSQLQPGNRTARDKTRLAYNDLWAYLGPIVEGR